MVDLLKQYDGNITKISPLLNISDTAFKKRCINIGIDYKSYKPQKIGYCIDCCKEISNTCKRCLKCYNIFIGKVNIPDKEILIDFFFENWYFI